MKTHKILTGAIALLLCLSTGLAAQQNAAAPENCFSLLNHYEPLRVEIETDMRQLKKDRKDEEWQPATFRILAADSVVYEQAVTIATRGNMRKKTCEFPPVKIRFFEEKPTDDSLADINELKLVVTCRNTESDEQLVLLESMAYGLYNLVTEESFRIKPAYITFTEPSRKRPAKESLGFFIESEQEMAARLGGQPLKPRIISPKIMDTLAFARMAVFQYMIGNTDWGVYTRHNIKVIGFEGGRIIAVPYDFDYAGLVDADYAAQSPDIPLQSVRQRYFLGMCQDAALYQTVVDEFLAKKETILRFCDDFPGLEYGVRQDARYYLNAFFSVLEDPQKFKKEIFDSCNRRVIVRERD